MKYRLSQRVLSFFFGGCKQIKDREQQELKLVRAAQLRHKAKTESLLFNQAHSAHHKRIVTETRQKDDLTRLQRQLQSEKMKNSTQVNKVQNLRFSLPLDHCNK